MAKRQFTKGIDLVNHQLKRLNSMKATIEQSVRMMEKQGLQDAIELTSGLLGKSITKGQYARGRMPKASTPTGRLRGRLPLLPINIQTGRLRKSMRSRKFKRLGFEVLSNSVPYAKFILADSGTRKMVARGMKKEARRRLKARQAAHVHYFVRKQRSI